jgi:hypothetical protein
LLRIAARRHVSGGLVQNQPLLESGSSPNARTIDENRLSVRVDYLSDVGNVPINPDASFFEQARTVAVREHPSRTVAGFFEPGDFIRLRELSLTLAAPQEWASLFRGRSMVVSLAARNVGMLWTRYTGVDPEAFGTTGDRPSEFQAFGPPTYYSLNLSIGF